MQCGVEGSLAFPRVLTYNFCCIRQVNTHSLLAFDSPNQDPLATIGITINENEHLMLPVRSCCSVITYHLGLDFDPLTVPFCARFLP
jgi:hypothetical protein